MTLRAPYLVAGTPLMGLSGYSACAASARIRATISFASSSVISAKSNMVSPRSARAQQRRGSHVRFREKTSSIVAVVSLDTSEHATWLSRGC